MHNKDSLPLISNLSEVGVVPPSSKETIGLILPPSIRRSSIFDKDWSDLVDRTHMRHPELTREHVDYTLIPMCQRAL